MEFGWMIALLVFILIACIVLWAARKLMAVWGLQEPIATTVYVILVVIFAVAFVTQVVPRIHIP